MTIPLMRSVSTLIENMLLEKTDKVQKFTASMRSRLPSNLRGHCWLSNISDGKLLILTDSPERASILRYQQHEILKQINEDFSADLSRPVRKLHVKVDYNLSKLREPRVESVNRQNNQHYAQAKKHLKTILNQLNDD